MGLVTHFEGGEKEGGGRGSVLGYIQMNAVLKGGSQVMILYLSSQQHTNLLDFLAEQEDALPVKKMTGNFMLKQFVVYDMRNFSHCTELILDHIAFGDKNKDFVHAIEEFLTIYNARITVICEGLKKRDPLYQTLLAAGVSNIVASVEIGEMRDEIRQSLSIRGMTKFSSMEREKTKVQEDHFWFAADGIRIAMISSLSRIWTTTTALGFAAWLGSVGASVAYVEKNGDNIIPYLKNTYKINNKIGGCHLEKI